MLLHTAWKFVLLWHWPLDSCWLQVNTHDSKWNVEVNSSSFGLKCSWIVVYNHWFVSAEISGINVAVPTPTPFLPQQAPPQGWSYPTATNLSSESSCPASSSWFEPSLYCDNIIYLWKQKLTDIKTSGANSTICVVCAVQMHSFKGLFVSPGKPSNMKKWLLREKGRKLYSSPTSKINPNNRHPAQRIVQTLGVLGSTGVCFCFCNKVRFLWQGWNYPLCIFSSLLILSPVKSLWLCRKAVGSTKLLGMLRGGTFMQCDDGNRRFKPETTSH